MKQLLEKLLPSKPLKEYKDVRHKNYIWFQEITSKIENKTKIEAYSIKTWFNNNNYNYYNILLYIRKKYIIKKIKNFFQDYKIWWKE